MSQWTASGFLAVVRLDDLVQLGGVTLEQSLRVLDRVAFGERHERLGEGLAARTVHRALQPCSQRVDATHMVAVVMRH